MKQHYTEQETAFAFDLIRKAIRNRLEGNTTFDCTAYSTPAGQEKLPCYVGVFKRSGEYLGVMGSPYTTSSLTENYIRHALSVCFEHPKGVFVHNAQDLEELSFAVLIVSTAQAVSNMQQIDLSQHGVIARYAGKRVVYLPRAAAHFQWNVGAFFENIASRLGVPHNLWYENEIDYETFTVEYYYEDPDIRKDA